jgi:hypothetical protein
MRATGCHSTDRLLKKMSRARGPALVGLVAHSFGPYGFPPPTVARTGLRGVLLPDLDRMVQRAHAAR